MQNSDGSDGDLSTLCCMLIECDGKMTNGSNHWILRQPDQVSKTETMTRETKVLFVVISDRLPSQCGNFFILTDLDIKCTMLYFTFGTLPCSNLTMLLKWLVAANRTLVSLAMVSVLLTWSGWCNIQ